MARILIVEDNKVIGDLLTLAIECMGYDVTLATSGAQALELLAKHNHEVVFTDIFMEPMSGLDFIDKMKVLHPRTVFAVMSGDIDPDLEDRCMEMGALAYVHKPVDVEEFQKVLKRALRRVERQQSGKAFKTPSTEAERPTIERLLLVAGDEVVRQTVIATLTAKNLEITAVADGLAAIAAMLMSPQPFSAAVIIPPLAVLEAEELGAQLMRLEPRLRLGLLGVQKTEAPSMRFHVVAPSFQKCEDVENIFRELVQAVTVRPAA